MELNLSNKKPAAFNEDGVQFGWDSTSIKLAETCLRKYKLKMIDGWQPKGGAKSVHLRFGGHYASALEHYHKHLAEGMEHDDAVVEVVTEALCDTWDRPACEFCLGTGVIDSGDQGDTHTCVGCSGTGNAEGMPWDSLDNLKTRATLIRSIVWYLEHYKTDPAKPIILANGKPAVELSFRLPVDDGIILCGHLDRLSVYADHPYVMDQKTTKSAVGPYYFDGFDPDTQMSLYTYAGQAVYNVPVAGVIIDAAQILVGGTRFLRGMTMRTRGKLDEWYDMTMWRIEQTQIATREGYFPMNPSSCGNFGGCEFRGICNLDPKARIKFLEAGFDRGPRWDPLESR